MIKNNNNLKAYYNKARDNWFVPFPVKDPVSNTIKKHKKYYSTLEEANKAIELYEYKKGNPIFIENNGIPLNKLMEYLNERKLKNKKEDVGQYGKNRWLIEKITQAGIGNKEISEISPADLEDFFDTLKDYSKSYITQWTSQFSQAFKYATKKNYISTNPLDDVDIPTSNKKPKKVRALEIEEQQKLTEYLTSSSIKEEPYKNAFLIQIYMGLRIGEALGLKRDDIDLQNNILHVRRTLKKDEDNRFYVGDTTKTSAGVRDIPIPSTICEYIIEQLNASKNNKDNLLFMNENNKLANPRNANSALKRIVAQQLKTTDISTHSLRHTFGTRCIESGISPVVVQRLMGHESIKITLDTYVSVLNNFKIEELDKLKSFYSDNKMFKKNNDSIER